MKCVYCKADIVEITFGKKNPGGYTPEEIKTFSPELQMRINAPLEKTILSDNFYCPPNYNLLVFCPRTKEKNCARERQDQYFKLSGNDLEDFLRTEREIMNTNGKVAQ